MGPSGDGQLCWLTGYVAGPTHQHVLKHGGSIDKRHRRDARGRVTSADCHHEYLLLSPSMRAGAAKRLAAAKINFIFAALF